MIIGSKTTGMPVPGVSLAGRKLFVEVLDLDSEQQHEKIGAFLCCATKCFAELLADPSRRDEIMNAWLNRWKQTGFSVTFTRQVNHDQLKAAILEG